MKSAYILLAFTAIMLAACTSTTNNTALMNDAASLPLSFNFGKMGFKVITSFINKKQGTMSTLYGNELALKAAAAGTGTVTTGEVFALVTWKQQADDHWFGAKIPSNLLSVEYVKTGVGSNRISYQKFEGKDLTLSTDTSNNQIRIKYIFDQKPSVMP
ncbi:hypothetical protein ACPPVU_02435 [Mucilaginibacter sp. McL0603]|uniref:hypothetical protein n=1 Tax=Mucilaginibacter sp. McL0603 TaxID=3415670 RepID=UPI003CFAC3D7